MLSEDTFGTLKKHNVRLLLMIPTDLFKQFPMKPVKVNILETGRTSSNIAYMFESGEAEAAGGAAEAGG